MMAISVVGSSFRICASSRREAFASLLSAAELKPKRIPAAKDTLTAGHLGAFNLGSFGSLLVHLVSDGNAGTRTYCSTYRSSNGCPLAFTYQSADNGTCCCTGATADYSTFGLVVHCAATAQQQCAAQK